MKTAVIGAALTGLLLTSPAHAGIQNVQSALATEVSDGFSGNITGSLDWRTGNISFLSMALGGAARIREGKNLLIGLANLGRKSSDGNLIFGRTFEHMRYRYLLEKWVLIEAFAQHEYDAKKRLNFRALGGVGLKADIFEGEGYGVAVGLAYMYELEQLSVEDGTADSGTNDTAHRMSSYVVGHYEHSDRLQLIETFYVQPRLTDAADTRLLNESSLVLKATKKLSLTTSFTVAYDNRTPEGIEKTDTALQTKLTYEWGGD